MNNAILINQTSGETEYYTQPFIIEAARATMTRIDLDPASSAKANETVKATHYYTAADDGLSLPWNSCFLWLNHPFGRISNPVWINKLVTEFKARNVIEACCITFACTSEAWFAPLHNYPQCYLSPRTNYLLPDGTLYKGVTKGSVVTCLTFDWATVRRFSENFKALGSIKIPYETH